MSVVPQADQLREEWLSQLADLVGDVQSWADELGWATRRIEIVMEDSQLGRYKAPALLMQEEAIRIILEPIARFAPGVDGVVDLYRMPAYDDIASLYLRQDGWHVQFMFPDSPTDWSKRDAGAKLLTRETLEEVLEEIKRHAVHEI